MELKTTGKMQVHGFRRSFQTSRMKLNVVNPLDQSDPEYYMENRQKKYWKKLTEREKQKYLKRGVQQAGNQWDVYQESVSAASGDRPDFHFERSVSREYGKRTVRDDTEKKKTAYISPISNKAMDDIDNRDVLREKSCKGAQSKKADGIKKLGRNAAGKCAASGGAASGQAEAAKKTAQMIKKSIDAAMKKAEEERNYHSAGILAEETGHAFGSAVRHEEAGIQRTVAGLIASMVAAIYSMISSFLPILLVISIILSLLAGILSAIFGGITTGYAKANVSAECERYRPLVQKYASMYGMSEYVELLLAVMMQESGGTLPDVMQAAEGAFNTKYPKVPNGIPDPEYSIECGVQELKRALEMAGCTGPTDLTHIKLALQGYNFGEGYITWAIQNYGGYSEENAAEFSDMMAARMGWRGYGDKKYVEHVLRYYEITGGLGNVPAGGMEIPLYDQKDYSGVPFGGGSIATSGCAPTSFAMVASYLLGREVTPVDAIWCGNQFYVPGAGTGWDYFPAAAAHFGIRLVGTTTDPNEVLLALSSGKPVISSQTSGLFTANGHFIVLRGVTDSGRVLVNDPNDSDSKNYVNREFDMLSEIHATSRNYWIFDR